MSLIVASRRVSEANLRRRYGDALLLDETSRGSEPWVRFSPFYPHGGIPIPFSPAQTAMSVEGIWQGLKVFERGDVDPSAFQISTMQGLKRTQRTYGKVLGHRKGLYGTELLDYAAARRVIYLPTYRWVLEHRLQEQIERLRQLQQAQAVILLDYETNEDVDDLTRPLSHAGLIKHYLEETWPA